MSNKTMSTEEDNNVVVDDSSSLEFVSFLGPGGFGYVSIMRDSKYRFCAEKSSLMDFLKSLEKELRIMLCSAQGVPDPSSEDLGLFNLSSQTRRSQTARDPRSQQSDSSRQHQLAFRSVPARGSSLWWSIQPYLRYSAQLDTKLDSQHVRDPSQLQSVRDSTISACDLSNDQFQLATRSVPARDDQQAIRSRLFFIRWSIQPDLRFR
ncbi:hypothetical protein DY000_02042421 [Brassica cretica]|uniref:Protein kinase domain-containing protein n=1 Tax=Brassica cretica TaxID=69181 RepID=A0ABQ7BBN6_BRACR|nr:hypothetical protein DY000_02042421 [Brassica cretica]